MDRDADGFVKRYFVRPASSRFGAGEKFADLAVNHVVRAFFFQCQQDVAHSARSPARESPRFCCAKVAAISANRADVRDCGDMDNGLSHSGFKKALLAVVTVPSSRCTDTLCVLGNFRWEPLIPIPRLARRAVADGHKFDLLFQKRVSLDLGARLGAAPRTRGSAFGVCRAGSPAPKRMRF